MLQAANFHRKPKKSQFMNLKNIHIYRLPGYFNETTQRTDFNQFFMYLPGS